MNVFSFRPVSPPWRVLLASLIGTTIEFYDFFIYATAAVLVFPTLFFPQGDSHAGLFKSLATFTVAYIARPMGSALFGHLGDRIGRKSTLVAALLTMGISTVLIGVLPSYEHIGVAAPAILALCRFSQGLGLGGEWGGAVLLATENAPTGQQAWFGIFPQLGVPLGFMLSAGAFFVLSQQMDTESLLRWGWRLPFLASALLVGVGLWLRLKLAETRDFQRMVACCERLALPLRQVSSRHLGSLLTSTCVVVPSYILIYLMTVFVMDYAIRVLGYHRRDFLMMQMMGTVYFTLGIFVAAWFANRFTARLAMAVANGLTLVFGLIGMSLLHPDHPLSLLSFLCSGFFIMGLTAGPCGTFLAYIYPANVRYTGASLSFNLAGVLGAAPLPYVLGQWLVGKGAQGVGYYLAAVTALSSLVWLVPTRNSRRAT